VEVHKPLSPGEQWLRVQHEPRRPLQIAPETDSRGVLRRGFKKDRFRQRISQFFYQDRVEPVTPTELAAAQADASHAALEGGAGVAALEGGALPAEHASHEH
jgi:ubiquinol-cytochrome c reductase cytochrome b subunit